MKKLTVLFALFLMCLQIPAAQADGLLYTESTVPADVSTQTPYSSKVGCGTCYNVLGLVEWGNCGFQAAMKNGRISQVHHYDVNKTGWIFFKKIKTEVYGN